MYVRDQTHRAPSRVLYKVWRAVPCAGHSLEAVVEGLGPGDGTRFWRGPGGVGDQALTQRRPAEARVVAENTTDSEESAVAVSVGVQAIRIRRLHPARARGSRGTTKAGVAVRGQGRVQNPKPQEPPEGIREVLVGSKSR